MGFISMPSSFFLPKHLALTRDYSWLITSLFLPIQSLVSKLTPTKIIQIHWLWHSCQCELENIRFPYTEAKYMLYSSVVIELFFNAVIALGVQQYVSRARLEFSYS
jgi:hypothetical protein